jgi:hypothetical protein
MARQQARQQAGPEFVLSPAFEDLLGVAEAAQTRPSSRSRSESKYESTGPDPARMTDTQKKEHVKSMLRREISDFNPAKNWNRTQTFNALQKGDRMDLLPSLQPYLS